MNLSVKQKQTPGHREQTGSFQEREGWGDEVRGWGQQMQLYTVIKYNVQEKQPSPTVQDRELYSVSYDKPQDNRKECLKNGKYFKRILKNSIKEYF